MVTQERDETIYIGRNVFDKGLWLWKEFKGQWYYIYHDGSYSQNGEPGGDCRRSVCAEYLYFNADGTIRFIPLTQEGLSSK